jgi:hypothetical protein
MIIKKTVAPNEDGEEKSITGRIDMGMLEEYILIG